MLIRIFFLILCVLFVMNSAAFSQEPPPVENGVSQRLARWRSANYSDVRYKLGITLERGAPLMKGELEINVTLTDEGAKNDLVLDWRVAQFAGDKDKPYANVISANNTIDIISTVVNEHLIVPKGALKKGANVIKIRFASPVKSSGAAVTRYIDREDGGEYIYSLFVPSDASTAFPCFDQPDLKARFTLGVQMPKTWNAVSNTEVDSVIIADGIPCLPVISPSPSADKKPPVPATGNKPPCEMLDVWQFKETQPISTYVFAFAAGDFVKFSDEGGNPTVRKGVKNPENSNAYEKSGFPPSYIYVRKSQAEKFKQHAAEVFRLNREGVKFLESYFDYKFPFPKYDLVLIPEFPFGGMEHAGATFLRESAVIFPSEPTANDLISRANVIFHEAAHQWFGDTVTMRWFDDLWLKEGFAEFMAYKTLEKVMPQYNAWKVFYERNKQAAYLTDSTKGTTPIYQEIPNLSAAKSAYGNIVYRKAPSFLKQAEFFFGEAKFQTVVRAFLKNHEFANAAWQDLVREIEEVEVANAKKGEFYQKLSQGDKEELEKFKRWSVSKEWAEFWVEKRGTAIYRMSPRIFDDDWALEWALNWGATGGHTIFYEGVIQEGILKDENYNRLQDIRVLKVYDNGEREEATAHIGSRKYANLPDESAKLLEEIRTGKREFKFDEKYKVTGESPGKAKETKKTLYVFPNYKDHGYGIFLLDERSRAYVLQNIQNEKDDFLRAMMWGSLWDSVREVELDPKDYVELVIKNLGTEKDEVTIAGLLGRSSTALNYYLSDKQRDELAPRLENLLIEKIKNTPALGQKLTFYRAFLNIAATENARNTLKQILKGEFGKQGGNPTVREGVSSQRANKKSTHSLTVVSLPLKTKDKFDIVTKLAILGDPEAPKLLEELTKTETSDDAKRYAYAAGAGFAAAKEKYFKDFLGNKEISESWIEAAFVPFNSARHSELTLPYLEKALAELPNLKRSRKIFFVNGWLGAFIGGQRSESALAIVNKFLADNPGLDKDLRLKILENVDLIERAVKIRARFNDQ